MWVLLPSELIRVMSVWVIEIFAGKNLDSAYLFVALMTAPIWLVMLIRPKSKIVRFLAHPVTVIVGYSVICAWIVWRAYAVAAFPDLYTNGSVMSMRRILQHPILLLIIFCQYQILCLLIGAALFERANRLQQRIPIELLATWFLGVFGVLMYCLRSMVTKGRY